MNGPSRYSAFEPDLMVWVLSTLVMAAVQGWEFVYGTLPTDRREKFYRDMLRFGTHFGVREQDCPDGWQEFSRYYEAMLNGDELASHPLCAEVCQHIIRPTASLGTRLIGHSMRFMVVETFPQNLREKMGLKSTPGSRLKMGALKKSAPRIFPRLPKSQRLYPEAIERLIAESS